MLGSSMKRCLDQSPGASSVTSLAAIGFVFAGGCYVDLGLMEARIGCQLRANDGADSLKVLTVGISRTTCR